MNGTGAVARPSIYRRRFVITTGPGFANADLEDDEHCYGATIFHDDERITAVEPRARRTPWDLCAQSGELLPRLVGMQLSPSPLAVYAHTNGKHQCTHMFETAGLAVAHAARKIPRRQYDIAIPVETVNGPRDAMIKRDGVPVLSWTAERDLILAPAPFAGQSLRKLIPWAEAECLDPDQFEAVVLLRRAMQISGGRIGTNLDAIDTADHFSSLVMGACYVYRPGVAENAHRNSGNTRDFTATPEDMLKDVTPALNFQSLTNSARMQTYTNVEGVMDGRQDSPSFGKGE